MKRKSAALATGLFLLMFAGFAWAHSPLCTCYDNGDGTVTCEGGFSDGSSASGVKVFIKAKDGKVLLSGQMNADSEFSFTKPKGDYMVEFNAGEGHSVTVEGKNIAE